MRISDWSSDVCSSDLLVVERRAHLGGNAFSEPDPETGIEVHRYGAHIFHTNNLRVWNWVQRFCAWEPYEHRVFTRHGGRVFPMPISRSEEHTSELQSLMRISYAVFCLKQKSTHKQDSRRTTWRREST